MEGFYWKFSRGPGVVYFRTTPAVLEVALQFARSVSERVSGQSSDIM